MKRKEGLQGYLRENRMPFEAQHHPRAATVQELVVTEHVRVKMFEDGNGLG